MNLKAGLLSLLAIAPLALGVPIQSCANQLQAFQPQVSPVDTRTTVSRNLNCCLHGSMWIELINFRIYNFNQTLKLSSPHTSEVGSVRWVRCDLRASQCIALVVRIGRGSSPYVDTYIRGLGRSWKEILARSLALEVLPTSRSF